MKKFKPMHRIGLDGYAIENSRYKYMQLTKDYMRVTNRPNSRYGIILFYCEDCQESEPKEINREWLRNIYDSLPREV